MHINVAFLKRFKNIQDSKEFWGLWQFEVEDIFLERGIRPSPAPFCLTSDGFKGLAKNIFDLNMPPCDVQCILLVLRLGTASHDVSFSIMTP